jgi:hypothetical protein
MMEDLMNWKGRGRKHLWPNLRNLAWGTEYEGHTPDLGELRTKKHSVNAATWKVRVYILEYDDMQ